MSRRGDYYVSSPGARQTEGVLLREPSGLYINAR